MRITARVLRPPAEDVKFFLSVEPDATFLRVWTLVQQRYRENYSAGRRNDTYFKKLQDSSGADIDMRDTVIDIFGEIQDPNERVVQIRQLPLGRDDTVPFDSYLHPPIIPPTPQEQEEIDRRRTELDRYGATLDNLDPDHPVESHESQAERRIDQDGFAIPARINRPHAHLPPPVSQTIPNSQLLSQDSYEEHLVRSPELGSPQRPPAAITRLATPPPAVNTATQYSTLDAVPSAQKPPAIHEPNGRSPVDAHTDDEARLDLADPISEDSQPRLSSSTTRTPARSTNSNKRKSSDGNELRKTNSQRFSNLWTEDETDLLVEGLAKELTHEEMKQNLLPNRSVDSIRKKAVAYLKLNPLAVKQRQASLAVSWTEDQDAHFVRAIRNNQTWKTLHDHRFRDRSDDSVKVHFAEVRKQLQEEDSAKSARDKYQKQLKDGNPSTGPSEKFTQEEDDLLLACRVENVEMKRVAKELFPRRPVEQVTNRAGSLLHKAKRAAAKANPLNNGRSPSVEFLFEHTPETRDRIELQRPKAREFKKQSSSARVTEFEQKSHQKSMLDSDRKRAEERRAREDRQKKDLEASEKAKKQDERVKRRRLDDDIKRTNEYKQQVVAWEKQAAIDKEAGRPIQPPPSRPLGSSIGTEISTTTRTPGSALGKQKTPAQGSDPRPSATSLNTQGPKKRRSSDVEVQVVITSSKKQKTAGVAEATPQTKSIDAKAASASKAPAISTPKRSAPIVARSAMAKLGRTTQPQKTGIDLKSAHERPVVTFASISATQPVGTNVSGRSAKNDGIRNLSSPGIPTAKSLRQSKLPFLRNGQQLPTPSARKSTPTPARKSSAASVTPRVHVAIDDSMFISSDEESSYDDKDITDEELNAVAERSEAMYSSSPVKSPQRNNGHASVQHEHQNLVSPGVNAVRSSPPVASMPTPNAKVLYGSAALKSATKTRPLLSPTTPSIPVRETTRDTAREQKEKFDVSAERTDLATTQEDEMSEFEMSTAENVFSDPEEDAMLDEDQVEHATNSTPVFPSSSAQAGAQDEISTASDVSKLPTMEETEVVLTPTAAAKNDHHNVSNGKRSQSHMHLETEDVEEIDCYRSDSREVESEDWPSEKSDREMPFPDRSIGTFGPFKVYNNKRTTPPNAATQPRSHSQPATDKPATASKEKSIGEQAMDAINSPAVKVMPPHSTAETTPRPSTSQSRDIQNGSLTSPTSQPSKEFPDAGPSGKKARRGQGRNKGSRILGDAHLFRPPPSTAPPDILNGSGLRKPSKRPVENNHEAKAQQINGVGILKNHNSKAPRSSSQSEAPSKQTTKHTKAKRTSLGFDESFKNMVEKGQALGAHSQATPLSKGGKGQQPASTQPVKKATPIAKPHNVVSSQPASNANAGRTINPHAFDWDNAQDVDELKRQADQKMRDAANMAPEDFWQPSNLVNMNEEQVLSHMIEQGVKRSIDRRNWEREHPIAAGRVLDDFTTAVSTQQVQMPMASPAMNNAMPRPATQPVMQVSKQNDDDDSSTSEDSDSEDEDAISSLENLSKMSQTGRIVALPHWR